MKRIFISLLTALNLTAQQKIIFTEPPATVVQEHLDLGWTVAAMTGYTPADSYSSAKMVFVLNPPPPKTPDQIENEQAEMRARFEEKRRKWLESQPKVEKSK